MKSNECGEALHFLKRKSYETDAEETRATIMRARRACQESDS